MKELELEVDQLMEDIKETDLYKQYLHLLKQVENSEDINILIDEIKKLQQQAVKEEHLGHSDLVKELDNIINDKLSLLNNIPLYKDYIEKAEELNQIVVSIKNQMQTYLDNLLL